MGLSTFVLMVSSDYPLPSGFVSFFAQQALLSPAVLQEELK